MCWTSPWRCPKARKSPDPLPRPCQHGRGRLTRMTDTTPEPNVTRVGAIAFADAQRLLAAHGLQLHHVADGEPIPGSYWGEPEAGIIASNVYVRDDTPVHSMLHEACHLIVLPPERRAQVHTDATDSVPEEDATCYLQIVLAAQLPGVGSQQLMADMDAWGYTYRLGSTKAWFEQDAEDARAWLIERGLPVA